MDVLVPHDLTELSDAGLQALRTLGTSIGSVHVLHVLRRVDPTLPGLFWPAEDDEPRASHARRALRDRLVTAGIEGARVHVAFGDPASRIVELANDLRAGLIVVPSHSRTGLSRIVLGSVAERVARFASCPVLIVPAWVVPTARPKTVEPLGTTPEEQVDALGSEITRALTTHSGYLTAARIAVPAGRSKEWWQSGSERRLADAGIVFVDLVCGPASGSTAEIVELRFEEGFAD